jgi:bromodomain adjacent to zinc finger domain protein 1A
MPLLRGEPFVPVKTPADLKADELVFVCTLTNEVFRNYDDFFNRQYICNTYMWTCEVTGQSNLTYQQALDSEREARTSLCLFSDSLKEAILSLLHYSIHTNMKSTINSITTFFKERFVLNEELLYHHPPSSSGEKTTSKRVKVINIATATTSSPHKVNVCLDHQAPPTPNSIDDQHPITMSTPKAASFTKSPPKLANLISSKPLPSDYVYVIQDMNDITITYTTNSECLSRPKHALTKEKIKLFLKNALYRETDRHPILVKSDYIKKYNFSPSPISHATVSVNISPNISSGTPRKRSLSQSNLDSFLMIPPSSDHKKPRMALSMLNLSTGKKTEKASSRKAQKSTPSRKKKSRPSSANKTPSVSDVTSAKTPSSIGAKKVLKKAKQMKQLDLRKSFVKKSTGKPLTEGELKDLSKRTSSAKKRQEYDQERSKLEKLRKMEELKERKRLEKLKKLELMKPREDTLCEDSKTLPSVVPVRTLLPPELFGDAIMVLEFLYHYGPFINLKSTIHSTISFGKLEEALVSNHPDTILYGIIKCLLQTIFATMEDEHEAYVELENKQKRSSEERNGQDETDEASRADSRRSSVGSIPMEGMEEVERSKDDNLASLKTSASVYARWSHITQDCSLFKLAFDPYTCSEILRLHLLSTGGYSYLGERNVFRYCNRGGFTDSDDPILEFRLRYPEIIECLGSSSIYDLSPSYKISILLVLSLQLLTFSASRGYLDEKREENKKYSRQIRELHSDLGNSKGKKKKKGQNSIEKQENKPDQVESNAPDEAATPIVIETDAERRQRLMKEINDLECQLFPVKAAINLLPLGLDRYHNKYWMFPSVQGLFVELAEGQLINIDDTDALPLVTSQSTQSLDNVTVCNGHSLEPKHEVIEASAVVISNDDGSGKVGIPNDCDDVTNNDSLLINQVSSGKCLHSSSNSNWAVYNLNEQIETLSDCLNPRGNRELALRNSIKKYTALFDNIHKCPVGSHYSSNGWCNVPLESSADEYLELYLREQLLDLEEKIYCGSLGFIADRDQWRQNIESSGAACNQPSGADTSVKPAQELAKALLYIQEGIEKKYLLPPLGGTVIDAKNKRKKNGTSNKICLDEWKNSLLKASSMSQIFLHLSTLERSVAWSKSLMNMRCRVCRRKGGDEYMLLCDGCDHGYHTYCLRPPIYDIPDGDWFCNNCCPVTPVKRNTRMRVIDFEEEASESESESEEEKEIEEQEEEDEQEEESDEEEVDSKGRSLRHSTVVQRDLPPYTHWTRTRSKREVSSPLPTRAATRSNKRTNNIPNGNGVGRPRKKLKLDDTTSSSSSGSSDKAEAIISSIIDVKCSKVQGAAQRKAQQTLEYQLSKALLDELMEREDSGPFVNSVRRRDFPDYHEVVLQPMDFKSIRQKVVSHKYSSLDQFISDVDLIFSNCLLYYKRQTSQAKAGLSLKKYFNHRCADLGLRNLLQLSQRNSTSYTRSKLRSSNRH